MPAEDTIEVTGKLLDLMEMADSSKFCLESRRYEIIDVNKTGKKEAEDNG